MLSSAQVWLEANLPDHAHHLTDLWSLAILQRVTTPGIEASINTWRNVDDFCADTPALPLRARYVMIAAALRDDEWVEHTVCSSMYFLEFIYFICKVVYR